MRRSRIDDWSREVSYALTALSRMGLGWDLDDTWMDGTPRARPVDPARIRDAARP